jgi:tetratricopeptide (TPR) repeat protein
LISGFILAIVLLPLAAASRQVAPPAPAQQPSPPAPAQKPAAREPAEEVSPVSVQQSPQLFAALCAAHAGGYEAGVPESEMSPLHAAVRREIAKASGPAVDALREFYRNHELAGSGETLSHFVSFGLVVGPPPRFDFSVDREDLPPDVLSMEGFAPLLSAYYREANLAQLYERVRPIYARGVAEMERTLSQVALQETGYMRQILKPSAEHTFTLYVEPLVGAKSNLRIYGRRYALVIDAASVSAAEDIRHSLLHYLLDDLAVAHHPPIAGRKALLDVVARAPRLPRQFRNDIEALADECLVKAVQLRIQRLPPAQVRAAVDAAEADGFVLLRTIYNALENYERGEDNLASYYAQIVQKMDLGAEAKRLATVHFASADSPSPQPVELHPAAPSQQLSELDGWLAEGESQLARKDTRAARDTFERVLEKYPDVPRALFGLAVASIVEGEVDRGKSLLEHVVAELANPAAAEQGTALGAAPPQANAPDPRTLCWAHVWLARIYEEGGRRDLAGVEYRAALDVVGAPEAARAAAQRGLAATGAKGQSP